MQTVQITSVRFGKDHYFFSYRSGFYMDVNTARLYKLEGKELFPLSSGPETIEPKKLRLTYLPPNITMQQIKKLRREIGLELKLESIN